MSSHHWARDSSEAEAEKGNVTTGWLTEVMAGHHLRLLHQQPDFECNFETARHIVYSNARKMWDGSGTLYVAPYGSEDATHWQVIVGAREAILGNDWMYVEMDAPLVLVNKSTGEIRGMWSSRASHDCMG